MDVYDIWCDLKPGISDTQFVGKLAPFLNHLKRAGQIESWRLLRCKLGLRPSSFAEWHILIETRELAQLDLAFRSAAAREGETDELHFEANALVTNGYMTLEALHWLVEAGLDALNVDVKGDARAVQRYCGIDVDKVWRNCKLAVQASVWLEKAARQGHAQAQHEFGLAHLRGEARFQDSEEAAKWLRRAAKPRQNGVFDEVM